MLIILPCLLLFILLILALPFHITASCSFFEEKFDYQIKLRWAWLLDLSRLIENQLPGAKATEAAKPAAVKKGKSRRTETKTIPKQPEPTAPRSASADMRNEPAKTASADPSQASLKDSEAKASPSGSSSDTNFQEIIDYIRMGMQYKDMFFTFLIKLFRLLHIKPLQLQGQLGLEDPADTAFLFSTCYTLLPSLSFCYFTVEPIFTGSICNLKLTLKCRISITEILLHLILDKDLRRPLIQVYRLYRAAEL